LRDSRKPDFQRRAGGIGKEQRGVEVPSAQALRNGPRALSGMEWHGRIQAWVLLPKGRQFLVREQGDMRRREGLAEPLQRGRGHHGIT
jgi:hypothetical protein